ncbi:uracil-DNA glycosylase [Sphingomicrobium marinum]|uniref:uracil-DNA glycosylase n=1 Tax=Sphingomicrobium marinum TaxID=1227950 RepID=UPI00223F6E9B|nr:uracil-DNA glycosylase [Sphingomicrobium marinum]
MDGIDRDAARALLEFYDEAGVDVAVRNEPPSWLEVHELTRAKPVSAPPKVRAARLPQSSEDVAAFLEMRSAAMKARHVPALGPVGAPMMILGDRPDKADAAVGKPFGGEAGQLFDRMLKALDLKRDDCARALLEPAHRPGEKVAPEALEELAALARMQVQAFKPQRLLLFGDAASRALLGEPLAKARGRLHQVEGVRTVATFHPRWLLKRPQDKAMAWADLLILTAEDA